MKTDHNIDISNYRTDILDDRHQILSLYTASCPNCVYFNLANYSCDAFPGGIPDLILSGNDLHHFPAKGQNKATVFKAK